MFLAGDCSAEKVSGAAVVAAAVNVEVDEAAPRAIDLLEREHTRTHVP